jgi:hypothetical protein
MLMVLPPALLAIQLPSRRWISAHRRDFRRPCSLVDGEVDLIGDEEIVRRCSAAIRARAAIDQPARPEPVSLQAFPTASPMSATAQRQRE